MKIFAGTYFSVFLSTNNGSDWTSINAGLNRSVYSLASSANETSGTNLFAGTFLGGVYLSTNNGTNWTEVNSGLSYENDYIYSLAILDQYIFAGTLHLNGGVWRRPLSEMVTSIENDIENYPAQFLLEQNYPNPFNPSTKIRYTIPNVIASETKQSQFVSLKIYDVLGKEVAGLVDEYKTAGEYEVKFNASQLPSGTYFYQLKAGEFTAVKKMILLK
ncbi:MAG: T9SS type A sorting domain-containing protein [bacterium]|nr:T9SS type A sorting domain-containing protein [bacterium]